MSTRSEIDPDLESLIREMERYREKPGSFAPDEIEVMVTRALNAVCRLALLKAEMTEVIEVPQLEGAGRLGRF